MMACTTNTSLQQLLGILVIIGLNLHTMEEITETERLLSTEAGNVPTMYNINQEFIKMLGPCTLTVTDLRHRCHPLALVPILMEVVTTPTTSIIRTTSHLELLVINGVVVGVGVAGFHSTPRVVAGAMVALINLQAINTLPWIEDQTDPHHLVMAINLYCCTIVAP